MNGKTSQSFCPILLAAACVFNVSALAEIAKPSAAQLGSPQFQPTPEHPVGWRGDGSGRFPAAHPPVIWGREFAASGYNTVGIVWAAPLPNIGVSSPIIVGDRIFLTSEFCDLVCLEKQTGKILWIRSSAEFEALSDEERKADPAYAATLAPLMAELAAANEEVVKGLNARLATARTAPTPAADAAQKKKRDLEKKIQEAQKAIDKKRFGHNWAQAVFGYSGATPTSDGQHVCTFYTTGLATCYDLEGHRQWIAGGSGDGSEHGNFASPLLLGNRLVVWANEMRAYDVATGKLAWSAPAKAFNTYGSLFHLQVGGEPVAAFQWGFFVRLRDGQPVWDKGVFGDSVATPIVEGDTIYAQTGYPKYNDKNKGLRAFKIPASLEGSKLTPAYAFAEDWADDEVPVDKKKSPFDRGYVSSPLYVDGLVYQVTQGGGLLVSDAATGAVVYRKVLPLKPKTEYWNWAGCGASPTLAGKYIYLFDNQGHTVIIEPGREFKIVGQNFIAESKDNKEQAQNLATPVFEGSRMYYRTPGYLYCIGDK